VVQGDKLLCERALKTCELPLEYVPNDQFHLWIRDKSLEDMVLAPMPAGNGSPARLSRPSGVSPYVASLYEMRVLTREQEVHLFRKMNYLKFKAGSLCGRLDLVQPQVLLVQQIEELFERVVATKNQIISANLRLVFSVAKRRAGPARDIFELVSDGNVSLMQAVDRFDYSLGNKFSTYATWAIMNNFTRSIPEGIRQRGRYRTDYAGLVAEMADPHSNRHELEAIQNQRKELVEGVLQQLNKRERDIIACRFGLNRGKEPRMLREMGSVMGVSKERIRQIEVRALGKMRTMLCKRGRRSGKRLLDFNGY
jgi:RNA polymerase primary sigma factor/RNA polymerase sigma factor